MSLAGLSACQELSSTYEPDIGPSQTPRIVSEVQKDDAQAALSARQHPQILARFGGEYSDVKTERLVARIEGALTAADENPEQSFRITILNSPTINAFALPGGYLYVTRGLLALASDASEVAGVLAHEMAHVTQNHGMLRQQREETEQINGKVVAQLLPDDRLAGLAALAEGKLRLAAFSRQQEIQADEIGIRTMGEAGYDPYAAVDFLDTMQRYNDLISDGGAGGQAVDFLADHPSTPQRVALARDRARVFGEEGKVGQRGRDYYLDGIDGMLYGPSPGDGLQRGKDFLLPELGVQFEAPADFKLTTQQGVTLGEGPNESALRFTSLPDDGAQPLATYMKSGWVTGLDNRSIQEISIDGMEAVTATAASGKWNFDVIVVRTGGHLLQFLTAAADRAAVESIGEGLRKSIRKMTPGEIRDAKPLRLQVITAAEGETLASLARRMTDTPSALGIFKIINGLPDTYTVKAGDRFKIISR